MNIFEVPQNKKALINAVLWGAPVAFGATSLIMMSPLVSYPGNNSNTGGITMGTRVSTLEINTTRNAVLWGAPVAFGAKSPIMMSPLGL